MAAPLQALDAVEKRKKNNLTSEQGEGELKSSKNAGSDMSTWVSSTYSFLTAIASWKIRIAVEYPHAAFIFHYNLKMQESG